MQPRVMRLKLRKLLLMYLQNRKEYLDREHLK